MENIFYFFTLVFIVYEFWAYHNAERIINKKNEAESIIKDEYSEYIKKNTSLITYSLFNLLYYCFIFTGLFSSQWLLFMIILGLSFIPKKTVTIRKADSFITIIILLFIVINKYHLHLSL